MSTPVDLNIVMPYGATMVGDGTQYAKLAKPHPKQNGGSSLNLPDGPCRVAASWAGNPDTVSVNMYEGRNFVRTLGKIQAGGVVHGERRREGWVLRAMRFFVSYPSKHDRHSRSVPHQRRAVATRKAVV